MLLQLGNTLPPKQFGHRFVTSFGHDLAQIGLLTKHA